MKTKLSITTTDMFYCFLFLFFWWGGGGDDINPFGAVHLAINLVAGVHF